MSAGWVAVLNAQAVAGGDVPAAVVDPVAAFLTNTPEGLGVPALRVEDAVYPQRDGAVHYADWYEARTVTLADVVIQSDECPACPSVRQMMADLMQAWSRHCDDTELVLFTDCHDPDATVDERMISGPFGVRGRPRVAESRWLGQGSSAGWATLRFDSVDHRLYILDADGTPGSGGQVFSPTVIPVVDVSFIGRYRFDEPVGSGDFIGTGVADNVPLDPSQPVLRGWVPIAPGLGSPTFFPDVSHSTPDVYEYPFFGTYSFASPGSFSMWWRPEAAGVDSLILSFEDGDEMTSTHMTAHGVTEAFSGATTALLQTSTARQILVVSESGSPLLLYIDGVLVETLSTITTELPEIGGPNVIIPQHGFYSDLTIYDAALTASQATWLFAGGGSADYENVVVAGTLCVPVTITFEGRLTNPRFELLDGSFVGLDMIVVSGQTVVINTETGEATSTIGGSTTSVVSSAVGDPFLNIGPGSVDLRVVSEDAADTGTASIEWRPAVVSA